MSEAPKKRGRPPKAPTQDQSVVNDINYEFNSFLSYQDVTTNLFGANIFTAYTPDSLSKLVQEPMLNNKALRDLSRLVYNANGIVTNTVDYMVAMPTLDRVVVSYGKSKVKSAQYKEIMNSTLRTIRDKEFIRDCLFRDAIDGCLFYYAETTNRVADNKKMLSNWEIENITEINELGVNISLISLPTDYCKIVGIKNSSYIMAFNLEYFDAYEGDSIERKLKKYPKEICTAYYKYKESPSSNNWVVLDNKKTIVHKVRSERKEPWGRPLVLAALNNIFYNDYFVKTKRGLLDEINNRVYWQTFPEGKEKGTSALSQKQQQDQHDSVKSAIMNKNNRGGISFFSVAAGTKIDNVKVDTTLFDEKNERNLSDAIAMDLGFGASLLNASSSGNYSTQQNNLTLIMCEVFSWVEGITYELNKVINENIINDKNCRVEVSYLPISLINRKEMFGYMKELYLSCHGSLQAVIAASGMSVDAYMAMLDMETEEKWDEKYLPHPTSYTTSGDKIGAPTVDDSKNENTLRSKGSASNKTPKPSTK